MIIQPLHLTGPALRLSVSSRALKPARQVNWCVRLGKPGESASMRPRESTHIYWRRVNRVIDHIKDHVTEPLPIAELARLAHFSPFHFHRIFRSIVGELHAFIRRLRLEMAVFQMRGGLQGE